ncbi:MAG: hypothetical protein ABSB32_21350, partial [Thermodesulfobacteriota bacterium]
IGFEGDLCSGLEVKMISKPFQDFSQLMGSQDRRSSSSEVNGIKLSKFMARDLHFFEERCEKIRDKGDRRDGIEGAIGALFNTEGDMDVEPGSLREIFGWKGMEIHRFILKGSRSLGNSLKEKF